MKTFSNLLISTLFLGIIFYFGIITWVTPDKELSNVENRSLAQKPLLQMGSVANGKYEKQFEAYITDQFYNRDAWIQRYLKYQIYTNQTFIFDYYIDGQWVYPKPFTTIDEKAIRFGAKNINELNEFAKKNDIELFYFSLPDRRHMLDANYPAWVEESVGQKDKEMFFSLLPDKHLNVIDVGAEWDRHYTQEDYRDFYYRTDHHWNMNGAFAAYEVIHHTLYEKSPNFTDPKFDKNDYTNECLADKKFKGIYNQQLYMMIDIADERLCYRNPKNADVNDWTVYVEGMAEENKVPYSQIYGNAKRMDSDLVMYADIYTGDYSELHVVNPEKADKGVKALILKDSYANPLLPLMADHFYQTTYYDIRHNEGENLYDFIKQHDYDMVMFFYSNGRTLEQMYDFGESGM